MNVLEFYEPSNNQIELTSGGVNFSYLKNNDSEMTMVTAPPDFADAPAKKRGRPKKSEADGIVKAEVVSDVLDDYRETNNLVRQTIGEIDTLTVELKEEMDTIRSSRTLKNKYMYLTNLSGNIGALLGTKIQAIKELNSVIKTANDLQYKKQKDMLANTADTDQQIYSLYNAFINSPVSSGANNMALLGPNTTQMSLMGTSGIVRADSNGGSLDAGYQNFTANMSPEQRMMIMEDQVKEVIVYDKATGQKYFDVVDQSGNSVPNVPRKDPMFLQDYVINSSFTSARNNNLNSVVPVIVRNVNVKSSISEY